MINLFETDPPERADILQVLTEIAADCEGRGFELKQVPVAIAFRSAATMGNGLVGCGKSVQRAILVRCWKRWR